MQMKTLEVELHSISMHRVQAVQLAIERRSEKESSREWRPRKNTDIISIKGNKVITETLRYGKQKSSRSCRREKLFQDTSVSTSEKTFDRRLTPKAEPGRSSRRSGRA